jgi:zinc/manganese transport system substrate-binding protein
MKTNSIFLYVINAILFFMCHSVFAAEKQPIKIVTTIPYLKTLVQEASCFSKKLEIHSIIAVGRDPHSFFMTPQHRIALDKAQIVIAIGSGFEPWLDKMTRKAGQQWLYVTAGMPLAKIHHDEKQHHHDSELLYDPHIWQSPELTKKAVQKIAVQLQIALPSEANNFAQCTEHYLSYLTKEVAHLKKMAEVLPPQKRVIATNHDALGYFAAEFDFKIYSILGLSDDAAPTAQQLKKIITAVKKENISAVFLESTGNMRNIKTVSNEARVKVGGVLYGDSLGGKNSDADTAPAMWRHNLITIINALKD